MYFMANLLHFLKDQKLFLAAGLLCSTTACFPQQKGKLSATERKSDPLAIAATSNNWFGRANVRGYMWVYADTLGNIKPSNSSLITPSKVSSASVGGGTTSHVTGNSDKIYQCWYYAETEPTREVKGAALEALFVDTSVTKSTNATYVDATQMFKAVQANKKLTKFISFSMAASKAGLCTIATLGVAGKWGVGAGAVFTPLCAMLLGATDEALKTFNGGDESWGAKDAQSQLTKQMAARVGEVTEVSWLVLSEIRKTSETFNFNKSNSKLATTLKCPEPSLELISRMDLIIKRNSLPMKAGIDGNNSSPGAWSNPEPSAK